MRIPPSSSKQSSPTSTASGDVEDGEIEEEEKVVPPSSPPPPPFPESSSVPDTEAESLAPSQSVPPPSTSSSCPSPSHPVPALVEAQLASSPPASPPLPSITESTSTEEEVGVGAIESVATASTVEEVAEEVVKNQPQVPLSQIYVAGTPVFIIPNLAKYVFTRDIQAIKGSDASNMFDEEVAEDVRRIESWERIGLLF